MSTGPSPTSLFLEVTAEELQCLHCEQTMFPPIFQCTHGHSACYNCNEIGGTNRCPLCTEKLQKIRYPVRCRFKSLECEHIIPYKYIEKHEYRECKYRLYDCPFFSNDYCSFTGDIPQVFSHLKDDHLVVVYDDGSSFKLTYQELNYPRHTIVVNHFGKQFCWHFELFPENVNKNVLVVTVRFMGEIEEGVQFCYALEIIGSQRKLVAGGLCGSIRLSADIEFPYDGAGLIFPNNMSHFNLEGNHSLEIEGHILDR